MYKGLHASARPFSLPFVNVCLVFTEKTLYHCDQELDAQHGHVLASTLKRADVKGDSGEFTVAQSPDGTVLALLGPGKRTELSAEKICAAAGGLLKGLLKLEAEHARVSVSQEAHGFFLPEHFGAAFGEGLGLANFRFEEYKKASKDWPRLEGLTVFLDGGESNSMLAGGLGKGLELAEAVNAARRMAATPPNIATTDFVAEAAQKLARACKLKCHVIKGAALRKNQLAGLENVGKASVHPPCLIELTYVPKNKSAFTLVLIGKTVCYDTGGLSIKPREGMRGMKYDKCGGMAILGAMQAVSLLKPRFRVVGLLPTAENSISDNALRVDDIIRYPNGVSVEVTNTDAEGRLVLADALIYACREHNPAAVIDLATLTGGVVVGLGKTFAGYWCEHEDLRQRLEEASKLSGERIWRLPMHDDYKELMKARHADLWNSAPTRDAHPIQGAAFLSNFIDAKIPWAHLDIAGTADIERDKGPFCAGPTGFGVRLLANLIENWK